VFKLQALEVGGFKRVWTCTNPPFKDKGGGQLGGIDGFSLELGSGGGVGGGRGGGGGGGSGGGGGGGVDGGSGGGLARCGDGGGGGGSGCGLACGGEGVGCTRTLKAAQRGARVMPRRLAEGSLRANTITEIEA